MTIKEVVKEYLNEGCSLPISENLAGEEIILMKIAQSDMRDSITLKGGIVMYNLTKNNRRATKDIDFDFIKYSISSDSILMFVRKLDSTLPEFKTVKFTN